MQRISVQLLEYFTGKKAKKRTFLLFCLRVDVKKLIANGIFDIDEDFKTDHCIFKLHEILNRRVGQHSITFESI